MLNRKEFIRDSLFATGALVWGVKATEEDALQRLTILHTNDVHSRLEPFPMDGGRNQGLGGVAARAKIIDQIRASEEQVLLFDAGDIFQGTPYFNIYRGEPDIRAMSAMRYDACTIGNHDFDAGMENLATQLSRHANFPMLVSNYDFSDTPMEGRVEPYRIFRKGRLKIGVFGVGIELRGLVPDNLYGKTQYLDPIPVANQTADRLKNRGCDLVVCLSHLGYQYRSNKVSDELLAKETEKIDVIIGGHTHTFFEKPAVLRNKAGKDVVINQVGWAGINLGRLDFEFSKFSGKKMTNSERISISEKSNV